MPSLASQLPQDLPTTTNPCRSELARDPLAPRSFIQTAVMPSLASQLPQDPPATTNPCRSELARDPLAPRSFRQTAVMPSLASQLPQDYRQPPQPPVGASLLAIRCTSVVPPDRRDAIAGKPAPTKLPPATTTPCRSELARDPLAPRSFRQTAEMPSLASQLPQDPPASTNPCRSGLARDPQAARSCRSAIVLPSRAFRSPSGRTGRGRGFAPEPAVC